MKMISIVLECALAFLLLYNKSTAQNIFPSTGAAGIGTTAPNSSSLLEIKSTTKGFLMSRMTLKQRNTIASPATGLLIYQTNNTPGFYYYSGSAWKAITTKAGWALTGNAGTDPNINFIGTTDAQPLVFKVNNINSGYIGNGFNSNTSLGYLSLFSNTTGYNNTSLGTGSLSGNTVGYSNVAVGSGSLANNEGNYNTGVGASSLGEGGGGNKNTAVGYAALFSTYSDGNNNTAIGEQTLYSNTHGNNNVAIGSSALYSNTDRSNLVAIGDSALFYNGLNPATGFFDATDNTAIGSKALYSNTSGFGNTSNGIWALYKNTTGSENVGIGRHALYSNTKGDGNTAIGSSALQFNDSGSANIAIGYYAMNNNTSGSQNVVLGDNALLLNATGSNNTAIGAQAMQGPQLGDYNTALGVGSGTSFLVANLTNTTALGAFAITTADNQVRIGSSGVTSIGGYAEWTNISDGRVKKNIKQNVPGLAFINKLKPITYNLDLDAADKIIQRPEIKDKNGKTIQALPDQSASRKAKEAILYTGFVAQDVEKAAKSVKYDFSGVDAAKNDKDLYGLRYGEFVVPLVKAVQELSKMNDDKDAKIADQQNKINDLETRLSKIETMLAVAQNNSSSNNKSFPAFSLDQNIPNPFTNTTSVGYRLSQKFSSAQIVITDKTGKTLKTINISGSGKGSITVDASTLASGAYQYSLIVDGKLITTKQMERLK